LFGWSVVIVGAAFACTAAWIGFLLWLIVRAVGIALA
jgi:hypothetical protein